MATNITNKATGERKFLIGKASTTLIIAFSHWALPCPSHYTKKHLQVTTSLVSLYAL